MNKMTQVSLVTVAQEALPLQMAQLGFQMLQTLGQSHWDWQTRWSQHWQARVQALPACSSPLKVWDWQMHNQKLAWQQWQESWQLCAHSGQQAQTQIQDWLQENTWVRVDVRTQDAPVSEREIQGERVQAPHPQDAKVADTAQDLVQHQAVTPHQASAPAATGAQVEEVKQQAAQVTSVETVEARPEKEQEEKEQAQAPQPEAQVETSEALAPPSEAPAQAVQAKLIETTETAPKQAQANEQTSASKRRPSTRKRTTRRTPSARR